MNAQFRNIGAFDMNLALIGATGYVGAKLLAEALHRGHDVTAIVRQVGKLPEYPRLRAQQVDVADTDGLARALSGQETVVSAFNPGLARGLDGARSIIAAVKKADVKRLLVVGGAGSLETAPGKRVVDASDFPAAWKAGALATAEFLDMLRREAALDWTFLSPAALLVPGERTGAYRVGKDRLLTDARGDSRISLEDYAVALLDELEAPKYVRARFTVAY